MQLKEKETSKILLVGLYKDTNLGDKVIFDCTRFLLENNGITVIMPLYLAPKLTVVERGMRKLYAMIAGEQRSYRLLSHFYYRRFARSVSSCDKIVFAGGGIIKWRYQFFWAQISAMCRAAEKYDKRLYFNTTGVEGYKEDDERCKILKRAVNLNCVHFISTRDDIDCLNKNYITNPQIKTKLAADPAVFASKVYGIKKQKSDVIGIGLIRKNIFKDNAMDFSGEQLCAFYIKFIKKLKNKNYNICLFTNGFAGDLELAKKICSECEIDVNEIVVPKNAEELVKIISEFKCVISGRLHACIISYSLGIPAIGLGWNDKLKLFGRNIGCPERFIAPENINAEYVFEKMKDSISQGYNEEQRKSFMQTQLESIKEIIND